MGSWKIKSTNSFVSRYRAKVNDVILDGKNETLISSSADRTIKNWDLEKGVCIQTLKGHLDDISTLSWYDDIGLVSGSRDKTIRLWDLRLGSFTNLIHTTYSITSQYWNGSFFLYW